MAITGTITRPITRPITRAITSGRGGSTSPIFNAPLTTSLVPLFARGSSTPTMVRATTGHVTDHEGILRLAISGEARFTGARRVQNICTTAMASWALTSNVTVTTGVTDPLGGTTAVTVTATSNDGYLLDNLLNYGITSGVIRNSIWVRRRTGTGAISLENGGGDAVTAITAQLTTTWQRFAPALGNGTAGAYMGPLIAVSGDAIDIAFPQTEVVTGASNQNPAEYVAPGSSHGANANAVRYFGTTNGNTVASNVVTEAAGSAISSATMLGYLAEGARTNICLQSQTLGAAAWVSSNVTVAADSIAAPDGTTTADTLTAAAGNATLIQDLGVIASAVKVFSIWLKRKTGTGNIDMTLNGGTNWTTMTITAAWARYEITATLADPDVGIRIVTDTDAVYAWGAQVEAAAFASSNITTVAAAVTRNADNLSYASAGNVNASATIFAEVVNNDVAEGHSVVECYTNATNILQIYTTTGAVVKNFIYNGSVQADVGSRTITSNTPYKMAAVWSANNGAICINGQAVETDASVVMPAASVTMYVGTYHDVSSELFGNVKNLRIYPVALADSALQALTA